MDMKWGHGPAKIGTELPFLNSHIYLVSWGSISWRKKEFNHNYDFTWASVLVPLEKYLLPKEKLAEEEAVFIKSVHTGLSPI
jgi:hypothetical protein